MSSTSQAPGVRVPHDRAEIAVSATARPFEGGGTEVVFTGRHGSQSLDVRFRLPFDWPGDEGGTALGDAAICIYLFFAMRLGADLSIANPVSSHLLERTAMLQEIFTCWHPHLFTRAIAIRATGWNAIAPSPGGRACFFSGGVDSFYSAVKRRDKLDYLVFVHGFDIPLSKQGRRNDASRSVVSAARETGIDLIEVETDIRELADTHFSWGSDYSGAAMAAVGHLLAPLASEVIVPASVMYSQFDPFSTSFITDPLWSSDAVRFFHDGCEASRIDKLRLIMDEPAARHHLRVCWQHHTDALNCERCEKCLRTMAALRALGRLQDCESFRGDFDIEAWTNLPAASIWGAIFIREILAEAEVIGDASLAGAARTRLAASLAQILSDEAATCRGELHRSTTWHTQAVPRVRDSIFAACAAHHPEWFGSELRKSLAKDSSSALRLLWRFSPWWLAGRVAADTLLPRRLRTALYERKVRGVECGRRTDRPS